MISLVPPLPTAIAQNADLTRLAELTEEPPQGSKLTIRDAVTRLHRLKALLASPTRRSTPR